MLDSEEKIAIGRLTKTFGVRGLIKFESYSGESAHLSHIKTIYLDKVKHFFEVETWILSGFPFKCKIKGFDAPETCKVLLGSDVLVSKKYAAKLKADEYYLCDLIGLDITVGGRSYGKICGVITDAYAPLIEVQWNYGRKGYIPFIKKFFGKPDMKRRSMELRNEALIEDEH